MISKAELAQMKERTVSGSSSPSWIQWDNRRLIREVEELGEVVAARQAEIEDLKSAREHDLLYVEEQRDEIERLNRLLAIQNHLAALGDTP